MDDLRLGAAIRAVRLKRGMRQQDLAVASDVSRATISLVERGHLESLSFATIRRIASAIDMRIDLTARWRGGDLERLLNRRHSLVAESFAKSVARVAGWVVEPEVTFSIYGERGSIDQLAWHREHAHLLIIEVKTQLADVNELLGTLDRKRRLAGPIAKSRGWDPKLISVWLIVADTSTNRRHAREHATLLASRFKLDGRSFGKLLRDPSAAGSGIAFWPDANGGSARSRHDPPSDPKSPS